MNGKKKERVAVPIELTRSKNHYRLQSEVLRRALEGGVLSNSTVTKVLVSSHGHVVDIVTSNSLPTGVCTDKKWN